MAARFGYSPPSRTLHTRLTGQATSYKLCSTETDLDFYARSQVKFHQCVNSLLCRLNDVEESLVRADLILITRILVHMEKSEW